MELEEQLYALVEMCIPIMSENPLFFLLNSYTTGLSPAVMEYLLGVLLQNVWREGILRRDRPAGYGEWVGSSLLEVQLFWES